MRTCRPFCLCCMAALPVLVLLAPICAATAAPPAGTDAARRAKPLPLLIERDGKPFQIIQLKLDHKGPAGNAVVRVSGAEAFSARLVAGEQTIEAFLPASDVERSVRVRVGSRGDTLLQETVTVRPARRWTVFLLPHSHVDIGYTRLQTEVEAQQHAHLELAVQLAAQTAGHPDGARFKWNSEVLWAVDSYLKNAPAEKREAFIRAVRNGAIELNALYGNELTALCRAEELVRLLDCASRLRREFDVPIETAMISDVPGYTWGIVPVLAGSGVRYFSIGPNRGDRIGFTLEDWGDRPFYWAGPSGVEKLLFWMAGEGYSLFHRGPLRDGKVLLDYLARLETSDYPYDMVQVRYSIGGDNGPPDPGLSDFVRDWNAKYASPRLVISTAREMFHAFEAKYGAGLPVYSGDFTPYWEDGAASSARETAFNRAAAERLSQAEVLWALLDPERYPAGEFERAWRNVVLYDEHTWGAHNSITEPDSEFVRGQWRIKQAFAYDADRQSRELLDGAVARIRRPGPHCRAVIVFNTCSWPRDDLVILSPPLEPAGARVTDAMGGLVPSQRLSDGAVAFLARDVRPFGGKRFEFHAGEPHTVGSARAQGHTLENESLRVLVDPTTGAVSSLSFGETPIEVVDSSRALGLNEYLYVPGKDPKAARRVGAVRVRVGEPGPLVASLIVESEAPGTFSLRRELRLVSGSNRLAIFNVIDKRPVRSKEGVHLAFPFRVQNGVMRVDTPWAVVRPEYDQLSGSCKNWFTAQRWVDISNEEFGVTWVTVDAPLVEVGAITAELPWIRSLAPTQTIYSYVMNNYWHTNYKADQEGPTLFRYAICPHGPYAEAAAHRFGIESSRPLIAVPVERGEQERGTAVEIKPESVLVSALRPDDLGPGWVMRLLNASDQTQSATLHWTGDPPAELWLSDLTGRRGEPIRGTVSVPAHGIVTLGVGKRGQP